jgi:hypothetical protein
MLQAASPYIQEINCNRKNTTACSFQPRKIHATNSVSPQFVVIFTLTWLKYSHSLRTEHVSRSSSSPRGRASTTLTHYISHNGSRDGTSNNVVPGWALRRATFLAVSCASFFPFNACCWSLIGWCAPTGRRWPAWWSVKATGMWF